MSLKDAGRRKAAASQPVLNAGFAAAGLKQPTIRINFNLDQDKARQFKAAAARRGETMTEALTSAVNEYVSKYP